MKLIFFKLWKFNLTTKKWHLLATTGDKPDKTVASHCGKKIIYSLEVFILVKKMIKK